MAFVVRHARLCNLVGINIFKPTGLTNSVLREALKRTVPYSRVYLSSCTFLRNKLFVHSTNYVDCYNQRGLTFQKCFSTTSIKYKHVPKKEAKLSKPKSSLFDIGTDVQNDVLLFSCYTSDRFYSLFAWGGILLVIVYGLLVDTVYNFFKHIPTDDTDENTEISDSWYNKLNFRNQGMRYLFLFMFALSGMLGIFVSLIVPSRTIREIYLKAGGKKADIVTFGPFGRNVKLTLPLEEINPLQGRTQHPSNLVMKIKNRRGYYTCDTRKGIFHDKQRFDFTVGLKRNF